MPFSSDVAAAIGAVFGHEHLEAEEGLLDELLGRYTSGMLREDPDLHRGGGSRTLLSARRDRAMIWADRAPEEGALVASAPAAVPAAHRPWTVQHRRGCLVAQQSGTTPAEMS